MSHAGPPQQVFRLLAGILSWVLALPSMKAAEPEEVQHHPKGAVAVTVEQQEGPAAAAAAAIAVQRQTSLGQCVAVASEAPAVSQIYQPHIPL